MVLTILPTECSVVPIAHSTNGVEGKVPGTRVYPPPEGPVLLANTTDELLAGVRVSKDARVQASYPPVLKHLELLLQPEDAVVVVYEAVFGAEVDGVVVQPFVVIVVVVVRVGLEAGDETGDIFPISI